MIVLPSVSYMQYSQQFMQSNLVFSQMPINIDVKSAYFAVMNLTTHWHTTYYSLYFFENNVHSILLFSPYSPYWHLAMRGFFVSTNLNLSTPSFTLPPIGNKMPLLGQRLVCCLLQPDHNFHNDQTVWRSYVLILVLMEWAQSTNSPRETLNKEVHHLNPRLGDDYKV